MALLQLRQWLLVRDAKRLQAHFIRVEQRLRGRSVSHLPAHLQTARQQNIQYLHEYALRGVFPHNPYLLQQPCFVDSKGRACAVAHLLLANGQDSAVKQVIQLENFAYVPEMRSPLLADWIAGSGFTAKEVAEIQPSYIGAPVSLEALRQLYDLNNSLQTASTFISILSLTAVILCSVNLARLLRRRIQWHNAILGGLNGLQLLILAVFCSAKLQLVSDIRQQICTLPNCGETAFHMPADLQQANMLIPSLQLGLLMAISFAVVVLLPTLLAVIVLLIRGITHRVFAGNAAP